LAHTRTLRLSLLFFFFDAGAPADTYTLSLHDALPICRTLPGRIGRARPTRHTGPGAVRGPDVRGPRTVRRRPVDRRSRGVGPPRSEEHTSELQSRENLVCRLLLEKKKKDKRHLQTPKA